MLLTKPRYYLPASYVLKARAGVASTAVSGHIAETIQGASIKPLTHLLQPLTHLLHASYTPLHASIQGVAVVKAFKAEDRYISREVNLYAN